jgi:hypothetical protein
MDSSESLWQPAIHYISIANEWLVVSMHYVVIEQQCEDNFGWFRQTTPKSYPEIPYSVVSRMPRTAVALAGSKFTYCLREELVKT